MLKLINLQAGYKKNIIIDKINLSLTQSHIHGLIGPNGSGKSTLLKTLIGLIAKSSGEIQIDNQNLNNLSVQKRAKLIGLHDSSQELLFSSTVKELLELSLNVHSDKSVLQKAIRYFDVEHLLKKDVLHLSSGERHRCLLAHAFATNPKVLLLDEPFAHLDWEHQAKLIEAIHQWKKEFKTVFIVALHEMNWLVQLADQVSILKDGQIQLTDSPEKVFSSPTLSETFAFKALIDDNPIDGTRRLTLGRLK
jgi:iron complex transport system ATP-binding protein